VHFNFGGKAACAGCTVFNPNNPLGRHTGEGRYPARKNAPRSGQNHYVVPLAWKIFKHLDSGLRRITSHLPACWLSGLASGFINDVVFSNGQSGFNFKSL
jgi:hypothetical protein